MTLAGQLTFSEMKTRVAADGISTTEAGQLLNVAYGELVTRSGWGSVQVQLATVADQASYTIEDDPGADIELDPNALTRIDRVWTDGGSEGGYDWRPISVDEMFELHSGAGRVSRVYPTQKLYALEIADAATSNFWLYPTPSDVVTLNLQLVITPDALSANGDIAAVPPEFHQALIDKARALIYDEEDADGDNRERLEARFELAVLRLKHFKKGRTTSGAIQAGVYGKHFR